VGSWLLSRWMSGMLFETTAGDPVTFVGMMLVLGTVSAVAGYLPARRASRIDPSVALRAN
jgi:ABC-type antimicrobial peptide transport system permease subunit